MDALCPLRAQPATLRWTNQHLHGLEGIEAGRGEQSPDGTAERCECLAPLKVGFLGSLADLGGHVTCDEFRCQPVELVDRGEPEFVELLILPEVAAAAG
jgi:hypothetical protein